LAFPLVGLRVHDSQPAKKDHVQKLVVEALSIERLTFIQVNYRTEIQNDLDCLKSEFAKYRMEIMEA
tara:strand:+ start:260 stop:460 length:201 start_codon:yes stop_codon:yes gene_type:complete